MNDEAPRETIDEQKKYRDSSGRNREWWLVRKNEELGLGLDGWESKALHRKVPKQGLNARHWKLGLFQKSLCEEGHGMVTASIFGGFEYGRANLEYPLT